MTWQRQELVRKPKHLDSFGPYASAACNIVWNELVERLLQYRNSYFWWKNHDNQTYMYIYLFTNKGTTINLLMETTLLRPVIGFLYNNTKLILYYSY